MDTDQMRHQLLRMAWEAHQSPQLGKKLPTDVLAITYEVLSSQNGWKKLDVALRSHFPEMYDQYGYAKIQFLNHYAMKIIPGTGSKDLFALTEEEVANLYKPQQ